MEEVCSQWWSSKFYLLNLLVQWWTSQTYGTLKRAKSCQGELMDSRWTPGLFDKFIEWNKKKGWEPRELLPYVHPKIHDFYWNFNDLLFNLRGVSTEKHFTNSACWDSQCAKRFFGKTLLGSYGMSANPTAGKSVCFTLDFCCGHIRPGHYRLMTGDDLKIFEVKNKKIEKTWKNMKKQMVMGFPYFCFQPFGS